MVGLAALDGLIEVLGVVAQRFLPLGTHGIGGLASFYAVCGLGALANIGIGSVLFAEHHRWWVSGAAGALVGSLWNFAAATLVTWRRR